MRLVRVSGSLSNKLGLQLPHIYTSQQVLNGMFASSNSCQNDALSYGNGRRQLELSSFSVQILAAGSPWRPNDEQSQQRAHHVAYPP